MSKKRPGKGRGVNKTSVSFCFWDYCCLTDVAWNANPSLNMRGSRSCCDTFSCTLLSCPTSDWLKMRGRRSDFVSRMDVWTTLDTLLSWTLQSVSFLVTSLRVKEEWKWTCESLDRDHECLSHVYTHLVQEMFGQRLESTKTWMHQQFCNDLCSKRRSFMQSCRHEHDLPWRRDRLDDTLIKSCRRFLLRVSSSFLFLLLSYTLSSFLKTFTGSHHWVWSY